jgi:hypothetical protein
MMNTLVTQHGETLERIDALQLEGHSHLGEESLEESEAIGITQVGIGGSLGVGHHPQDITLAITNPGNVLQRSVGIAGLGRLTQPITVAKHHLALILQRLERIRSGVVAAFAVGHGQSDHLARVVLAGPRQIGALHPQGQAIADKMQISIPHQGSGQQTNFS